MQTSISIEKSVYRISIPVLELYENSIIRDFTEYINAKNTLDKSDATDNFIESLSNEVKASWFDTNKHKFIL